MIVAIDSVEAVQDAVRSGSRVLPAGGGSKPALSTPAHDDVIVLDVSGLRGILEYDPSELTFTAMAGTPVAEVTAALAEHGQYLPFDPPLGAAGATLGGVVAGGTSGANAFRHGGVRDFVIGVRLVEGTGRVVAGGGKVVKNAAGFDLPKLMVGSIGRLGVMVQLSFKVFPRPPATTTLIFELGTPAAALAAMAQVARGPVEADALDLEAGGRLLVRLGGDAELLDARAARCGAIVGTEPERLDGDRDAAAWRDAAELAWVAPDARLVRVALTARAVGALDAALAASGATVRYSLAANVAWIAWPESLELEPLDTELRRLGLAGVVLTGAPGRPLLGAVRGGAFAARVRSALDPNARFPED
ncbi:MAG: glycolate oxidase binding subunit [Baekduia sp.]|nr:glycolate oxidase binding subunit [Baekduia sp.]